MHLKWVLLKQMVVIDWHFSYCIIDFESYCNWVYILYQPQVFLYRSSNWPCPGQYSHLTIYTQCSVPMQEVVCPLYCEAQRHGGKWLCSHLILTFLFSSRVAVSSIAECTNYKVFTDLKSNFPCITQSNGVSHTCWCIYHCSHYVVI